MLTTEIKLIIAGVVLALLGYSYYWTYDQGRKTGASLSVAAQAAAVAQALKENDLENKALREKEMREARQIADKFATYHKRTVKLYEQAIDNLKKLPKEDQVCLARPVDDATIELRNAARGYDNSQG